MGTYISAANLKLRVAGKIRFSDDDTDENAVGPTLLDDMIAEAEAEIESRLSVRYYIPFQTDAEEAFTSLPNTTQNLIKRLCYYEAIRSLLGMDFGRGSAVDGEKYAEQNMRVYNQTLDRLVMRRDERDPYSQWKYPPLESLRLALHNRESDDGYSGRIYLTSENYGEYAAKQMPSPGETVFSGRIIEADDELD